MVTTFEDKISLDGLETRTTVELLASSMEGGINQIPVTYLDFLCSDPKVDLGTLVGKTCWLELTSPQKKAYHFCGLCISAEAQGVLSDGLGQYTVELRPWLWLLTRSRNNRIFQNKKAIDIVQDVIGLHGFSGDLKIDSTANSSPVRDYCTQYRETDFAFVKRLLEEEGLYFYFNHSVGKAEMVITGSIASHPAPTADFDYAFQNVDVEKRMGAIGSFGLKETTFTQKITLDDYNFEEPTTNLQTEKKSAIASSQNKKSEYYDYPGRYRKKTVGQDIAGHLLDAEETGHRTWRGAGDVINLAPGKMFKLSGHPDAGTYMATKQRHFFRRYDGMRTDLRASLSFDRVMGAPFGDDNNEFCAVYFDAVIDTTPFRMRPETRKPEISGVQTAVVVGKSGEEQYVDKYGRIKVQFHWDRDGKKDENSSCYVRTMMPWAGEKYGMVAWPRMGQEVVIQFEEGDPDRPLCVGMLYNANNLPPYKLPGNQTRTGLVSRSTKAGKGYNELLFEDKKGSEMIRMEAEKDFVQTVQNASHTRVGYGHSEDAKSAATDEKSMLVEIAENLTELIEKGDHTFELKTGSQKIDIKKDKTETIKGKSTRTVTGNVTQTIKQGNQKNTVNAGNYKLETKAGKIDITAMQSITLKVGGNSIKIDQTGITIKGLMVKIEGSAMLQAKSPMTTVKGDGMLILKGGLTMIN